MLDTEGQRALEVETKGLALEQAIHVAQLDEQRLYAAMRANFARELAAADIGAMYANAIRRRMRLRAEKLAAERAKV